MPIARIILPWQFSDYPVYDEEGLQIGTEPRGGSVSLPDLPEGTSTVTCTISYTPPPVSLPYALVELNAPQSYIDTLSARPDCLFLCYVTEEGFVPEPLTPADRVVVRDKIASMNFPNLGLINAAIQASQNRSELVVKLAVLAFAKNVEGDRMEESEVLGGYVNRTVQL